MELIENWRKKWSAEGNRLYVTSEGKQYTMSLSQTCLGCHSNKEQVLRPCHNYRAVKPACWSCHTVPQEGQT